MSAGPFEKKAKYQLDSDEITYVRNQPESAACTFHTPGGGTQANDHPSGTVNSKVPGVRVGGSKRTRNVVHARTATLQLQEGGTVPANYSPNSVTTIPIFSKTTFGLINNIPGVTASYLGATWNVIRTQSEVIRF